MRGKSAITSKTTNYSHADPQRHLPMLLAPMVATLTSKTQKCPKICHHHSLPEHQRVNSLTQMSITTTRSETTCHLISAIMIIIMIIIIMIIIMTMTFQAIQLRPPAHRRRDSATKRSDSSSTKKSRKWRRLKCAETSSCINTVNMATHAATLTMQTS